MASLTTTIAPMRPISSSTISLIAHATVSKAPRAPLFSGAQRRPFSAARAAQTPNTDKADAYPRLLDAIRTSDALETHLLLSASSRVPLLTLWTASWSRAASAAEPVVRDAVARSAARVLYAEVQIDAPDVGVDVGARYGVTKVPTLLAFVRREPRRTTMVEDELGRTLVDGKWVAQWVRAEEDAGERG